MADYKHPLKKIAPAAFDASATHLESERKRHKPRGEQLRGKARDQTRRSETYGH
jgi:hypothetical protein